MLFLFRHLEFDAKGSKWNPLPLDIVPLKHIVAEEQEAVREVGWRSLFLNNHDQPRVVSRWGDTSTEELRSRSAKAIALMLHMHRGTPYIYQGEELGMTNAGFTELKQYRDIESLDLYRHRVLAMHLSTHEQMINALASRSRDNSRTPMQWDNSEYAGFTSPVGDHDPWMPINPNKSVINVASESRDPNSVLAFYKELIRLRHTNPVVSAGDWHLLDADDKRVYAFRRTLDASDFALAMGDGGMNNDDGSSTRQDVSIVVVANLTGRTAQVPPESAGALGLDASAFPLATEGAGGVDPSNVLISTYPVEHTVTSLLTGRLEPWEAFAYCM
jgi:oligo-1,6-glucosidase